MSECINENMISVVIPVYNGEKYIVQCLDSLLESSCCKNMEVIIIDDGSDDSTVSIINNYLIDRELNWGGGISS